MVVFSIVERKPSSRSPLLSRRSLFWVGGGATSPGGGLQTLEGASERQTDKIQHASSASGRPLCARQQLEKNPPLLRDRLPGPGVPSLAPLTRDFCAQVQCRRRRQTLHLKATLQAAASA